MNNTSLHATGQRPNSFRRGAASVEYVSVCAVVIAICIGSAVVLGESIKGVLGFADEIALVCDQPQIADDSNNFCVDPSPLINTQILMTSHAQFLALTSTFCMLLVGFLYVKQYKKRKRVEEADTCEVTLDRKQSEALAKILGKRNIIHAKMREDWLALFEGRAAIKTYMSTNLVTVRPGMSVEACLKLLKENDYRRVMVTHQDGRMAGVVSRKDFATKRGRTVADVMTSKPKTAAPDTSLRIALTILLQHRVSCLPVVENGYLVGLLSTSDLMVVLQCVLVILSERNGAATIPTVELNTSPAKTAF